MKRLFGLLACAAALLGTGLGASAPAVAEDAKVTLLHSPWLALRFEQDGKMVKLEPGETLRSEVRLKKRPFTIVLPVIGEDDLYQIAAWDDASIFKPIDDQPRTGLAIKRPPFFRPATGMADTDAGSGRLMLNDKAHHYLSGLRLGPDRDRHVFHVSSILADDEEGNSRDLSLRSVKGPLYLVAWYDKNGDGELNYGEYEYLVLRFR